MPITVEQDKRKSALYLTISYLTDVILKHREMRVLRLDPISGEWREVHGTDVMESSGHVECKLKPQRRG